jgi:tetratricopeptide (TPR) repeat protein
MSTPTLAQFEHEIGARMARSDFTGATALAAACRAAWPEHSSGWLLGSFAALCNDQAESALALIEACLARGPGDAQFLLQQAECLSALGRRSEAMAVAAKIGSNEKAGAAALDAAGQFLVNVRAYAEALPIYDRALELEPRNLAFWAQRSVLHRLLGQFDLAARDFEAILAFSPLQPDALKGLVDLEAQSLAHNQLAALEVALAGAPPGSIDAAVLNFALAKSHEDIGNHDSSWRHLMEANRLERARSDYRPENDREVVDEIIAAFPEIEAEHAKVTGEHAGVMQQRPIFILGLPRTGTTLVERILGSHSQVHAAGELSALSRAIGNGVNRTPQGQAHTWREFAARLNQLDSDVIARGYLALARPYRGDLPRFLDKQPTNFYYCSLILRAFPHAQIVQVNRHPLAACYAIYKTRFDAGFPFAYDLQELADFYVDFRRLMAHWHRVLPGRILEVAYEDIVTAQEPTTRRLLEDLGLPFEQSCLDFNLNSAPMTNTASSRQVRQPLYDSSLNQWRHYAEHLAPLRARLEAAGIRID